MNIELTFKPRSVAPRVQWQLEQEGLPPLLARLYAARGVTSRQQLDYELKSLIRPAELTNASEAAILLADALEARAKIIIVADYDCDGATACAVAVRALREFSACVVGESPEPSDFDDAEASEETDAGPLIDYLVPNRFITGYGLSPDIVKLAAQKNPDLIVTVDNGITSVEGVALANELGIATLITDHHLAGTRLPEASVIVNPNQPGCAFPSKALAGVGVMFYVMLALRAELRERGWFAGEQARREPNLAALLDLVALGTVADVVKLDYNNRILVSQGLKRMREGKTVPGIAALMQLAGRNINEIRSSDLGFIVGPRLNAAGRLTDMSVGIECLLADEPARALFLAQQLDTLNRERKEIESAMQAEAKIQLKNRPIENSATQASAIALFDANWHQGVVGIVASRLKDHYHRPVFAFAPGDNQEIKGSGRSIAGVNLRDLLDEMAAREPDLLTRYGGHALAAGATLHERDFPRFATLFLALADELLSPEDLLPKLVTDGPLEASYFSLQTAHLLENEIWGQGFESPLFEDEFTVVNQRIL